MGQSRQPREVIGGQSHALPQVIGIAGGIVFPLKRAAQRPGKVRARRVPRPCHLRELHAAARSDLQIVAAIYAVLHPGRQRLNLPAVNVLITHGGIGPLCRRHRPGAQSGGPRIRPRALDEPRRINIRQGRAAVRRSNQPRRGRPGQIAVRVGLLHGGHTVRPSHQTARENTAPHQSGRQTACDRSAVQLTRQSSGGAASDLVGGRPVLIRQPLPQLVLAAHLPVDPAVVKCGVGRASHQRPHGRIVPRLHLGIDQPHVLEGKLILLPHRRKQPRAVFVFRALRRHRQTLDGVDGGILPRPGGAAKGLQLRIFDGLKLVILKLAGVLVDVGDLHRRRLARHPGKRLVQVLQVPQVRDVGSAPIALIGEQGIVHGPALRAGDIILLQLGGHGKVLSGGRVFENLLEPRPALLQRVQRPGIGIGRLAVARLLVHLGHSPAASRPLRVQPERPSPIHQPRLQHRLVLPVRRRRILDPDRQLLAVLDLHDGRAERRGRAAAHRRAAVVPHHLLRVQPLLPGVLPQGINLLKRPDIFALPGVKYIGDAPRAHVISFLVHIELVYNIKGALAQRGINGPLGQEIVQRVLRIVVAVRYVAQLPLLVTAPSGQRADAGPLCRKGQRLALLRHQLIQPPPGGQQHRPVLRRQIDLPGGVVQLGDLQPAGIAHHGHHAHRQQDDHDGRHRQHLHQSKSAVPFSVCFAPHSHTPYPN